MSESEGQLQDYSVDQAAGAVVLVLGAVASLLLVIWQSKCHCKINLCYIFQCERRPPSEEEMKGLKHQSQKLKDKKVKDNKDDIKIDIEDEPIIPRTRSRTQSFQKEPEPEPEPTIDNVPPNS